VDNNTGNFGGHNNFDNYGNQGSNDFNRKHGFEAFKGGKSFNFSNYKGSLKFLAIIITAVVIISIVSNLFFFTVDEREQVVVKQFNEVVKIIVDGDIDEVKNAIASNPQLSGQLSNAKIDNRKGLHFKIPFLQNVEYFTSMLMTFDGSVREVITKDQKKLVLDNYAVWKIINPALFAMSVGNETEANKRLDDIIYSKINEEVGKVEAHVVISDKNYVANMLQAVVQDANEHIKKFGMEVVAVRIKRTDLPEENYNNIFNRMKTEREKAAKTYRSEGQEEAQKIRSEADREATIIEANAYKEAERIKGEGDAEAARIYAEAYNKDPEFYAFWRSLQAYKKTLKENATIVIDKDSEFVKFLYGE